MKIFLDTANLDEIQQASDFGLLDGITTNPTLAAREGRPFRELILKACEIVKDGIVDAEVVSTDTEGMLREGRELAGELNMLIRLEIVRGRFAALGRASITNRKLDQVSKPECSLQPLTTMPQPGNPNLLLHFHDSAPSE